MSKSLLQGDEGAEFLLGLEDPRKKRKPINTPDVQQKRDKYTSTTDRGTSFTQPAAKLSKQKTATYNCDKGEDEQDQDWKIYPNVSDDSENMEEDSKSEEKEIHRDKIIKYTEGLL